MAKGKGFDQFKNTQQGDAEAAVPQAVKKRSAPKKKAPKKKAPKKKAGAKGAPPASESTDG